MKPIVNRLLLGILPSLLICSPIPGAESTSQIKEMVSGAKRIVFVGDSITYGGQYVEMIETGLRMYLKDFRGEILNVGLPSETVSGLSEPGHAGGAFPRPDLHERLDRVLAQTHPDLVIACYGMNDGIYYPFSEDRFQSFQSGIKRLRDKVTAVGASIIHVTPPVFDSLPIRKNTLPAGLDEYRKPFEGYDNVLNRYAQWLLSQRSQGWHVIDIHGPLRAYLTSERERKPQYTFAGDGVHPNETGHWLMARQIMIGFGLPAELASLPGFDAMCVSRSNAQEIHKLIQKRQRLLKDAWLTAIGHKRPGMNKGLPLEEAKKQASALDAQLIDLMKAVSVK